MKIKFVDAENKGKVLHEVEKFMYADAKAVLPRLGEEVQLGRHKLRVVTAIRYRYGKHGPLEIRVSVRRPTRSGRTALTVKVAP